MKIDVISESGAHGMQQGGHIQSQVARVLQKGCMHACGLSNKHLHSGSKVVHILVTKIWSCLSCGWEGSPF